MDDRTEPQRSRKNMESYIEKYHVWGGGLTLPMWTDVQGWKEGNVSIPEVPSTPVPSWVRKMLGSRKNLTEKEG
jgi:hypothetical protein